MFTVIGATVFFAALLEVGFLPEGADFEE